MIYLGVGEEPRIQEKDGEYRQIQLQILHGEDDIEQEHLLGMRHHHAVIARPEVGHDKEKKYGRWDQDEIGEIAPWPVFQEVDQDKGKRGQNMEFRADPETENDRRNQDPVLQKVVNGNERQGGRYQVQLRMEIGRIENDGGSEIKDENGLLFIGKYAGKQVTDREVRNEDR